MIRMRMDLPEDFLFSSQLNDGILGLLIPYRSFGGVVVRVGPRRLEDNNN